jgi:putative hydrolase of the HAD superfamily
VLFDAMGTLIELREPVGETYARMARPYGVALPAQRVDDAFRRSLRRAPPLVFPDAIATETERRERDWWRTLVRSTFLASDSAVRFSDFDAFFDALYRALSEPDAWSCKPGCREALTELRARGLTLGIVSNFDRRLPRLLEGLAIAPLIDAVVLPSDAGAEKPDPRIFQLALERLGTPAAASVFVGDSVERDIAGARAAGMRAIDVGSLATLCELPERLGALATTDLGLPDE